MNLSFFIFIIFVLLSVSLSPSLVNGRKSLYLGILTKYIWTQWMETLKVDSRFVVDAESSHSLLKNTISNVIYHFAIRFFLQRCLMILFIFHPITFFYSIRILLWSRCKTMKIRWSTNKASNFRVCFFNTWCYILGSLRSSQIWYILPI